MNMMKLNNHFIFLTFEGEDEDEEDEEDDKSKVFDNEDEEDDEDSPDDDWRQSLSEDLRNNEKLKDAGSLEDFVAQAIKDPSPVDPQSYELPENLDDKDFRKALSEANISADGLKGLLSAVHEQQTAQFQAAEDDRQSRLTTLFDEWGDKKDENLNLAEALLKQYDEDGNLAKLLKTSRAGNDSVVISFFHKVAKDMKEDGILKVKDSAPPKNKTAANVLYPNQGKE